MKGKLKNLPFSICIFSVIFLSLYISIGLYKKYVIQENTFRLHVVANSNSTQDQIVKLKIANKLENYINSLINSNELDKKDIYTKLSNNINNILDISNDELKSNDFNYTSSVKLGKIKYTERENIYVDMSNGTYDSIEILLGKAEGKNYWNLLFPNKDNISNLEGLENILPGISDLYTNESLKTDEKVKKTYEFKIIEVLQNIL